MQGNNFREGDALPLGRVERHGDWLWNRGDDGCLHLLGAADAVDRQEFPDQSYHGPDDSDPKAADTHGYSPQCRTA